MRRHDPVAPARRPDEALRKASHQTTSDGQPVHGLTLTRNRVRFRGSDIELDKLVQANPHPTASLRPPRRHHPIG